MTNKTKIIIGVGSAVALIGGYFIYKALRPKKPIVIDKDGNVVPPKKDDTQSTTDTPPKKDDTKPYVPIIGRFLVNTKSGVLYVRDKPSKQGKIVAKLNKGCVITAQFTDTNGWVSVNELNADLNCNITILEQSSDMFVSVEYLKPLGEKI